MTQPRQLGRYELLEQLGEGGMGTVWLARLTGAAGFEKLCIVKTVLPSIAKDAEFVSRFLHEGRVLTQLSHGNIAQVLDMNEVSGQLFLALEYVGGVDLARLHEQVRAAQEFMPLPLVMALIAQAAEGLGAAHRKHALDGSPLNIVHRDVSPHNIMVSYEGEVKVIDFGIAKSEARSRHTAQASVMGKLGYMAPEQARGEPLDHRADQFALSIVAWELLSNQSWVRRGTLTEMVLAMANPTVRPLAPLRPDVPPSLEAVILKALALQPEGRFATTDEFAQELTGELLKLGPPPTKVQLGEYVRSRCSADFAVTRQLLTRISTQRSPPPQGEQTQGVTSPGRLAAMLPRLTPLEVQRPSTRVNTPAAAPLTTQELAVVSPQRRSALWVVGGLLAFALMAAVAVALRLEALQPALDAGTQLAVVAPVPVDVVAPVELVDAGLPAAQAVPVVEQPTLPLQAHLSGKRWILTNLGRWNWVACRLTMPGQLVQDIGTIPKGQTEVPTRRLRFDPQAPALEGQARLDCSKGFGLIQLPR